MSREARVGALVVALFAVLLYLSPGSSKTGPMLGNTYNLVFNDAGGLREGDTVKYIGVPAGRVSEIVFTNRSQREKFGQSARVVVRATLDFGISLPVDSRYSIARDITGNRWLEITPGYAKEVVKSGEVVKANVTAPKMDQLQSSLIAFKELSERTRDLRATLADPKFRRSVKDTASNFRFYSNEFVSISRQAGKQVSRMDRDLDEQEKSILAQLDRMDAQVAEARRKTMELAPQINEEISAWDGRIRGSDKKIRGMIDTAERETGRFRDLARTVETRVVDGKMDEKIREEVLKLATRIDEIAALAEDMHNITSSPEVKAELQGMIEKYRRQAEDLRKGLEGWERAIP